VFLEKIQHQRYCFSETSDVLDNKIIKQRKNLNKKLLKFRILLLSFIENLRIILDNKKRNHFGDFKYWFCLFVIILNATQEIERVSSKIDRPNFVIIF
jgi:hypothetical protein